MAYTPDAEAGSAAAAHKDYAVSAVLREGWGGTIREGRYIPTGRMVTVQRIREALVATPGQRDRLAAVGRTVAAIHDPHLVAVFDLVEARGALHLVADWTEAMTLEARLRAGPLHPDAVLAVLDHVLAGLAALHAAGAVHGHVSPETIVVEADGRARLAELAVSANASLRPSLPATDVRDTALLGLDLLSDADHRMDPVRRRLEAALGMEGAPPAAALRAWLAGGEPHPQAPAGPLARPGRQGRRLVRWGGLAAVAIALGAVLGTVLLSRSHTGNGSAAPLVVGSDASLTVSPPSGGCDTTFTFVARGSVVGTGTMVYRWEQSDGQATADTPLSITTDEAAFQLTQAWRLQGSQTVSGSMRLHILKPADRTLDQKFAYTCP